MEETKIGNGAFNKIDKTLENTSNNMSELRNLVEEALGNSSKNTTTTTDKNGNMEVTVNVTENSTENRNVNVVVTAETDSSVKQTTEEVKELGNAAEETSKKLGELGETASQTGESTKEVTKEAETTEQALTRMNNAVDKFNKRGTPFASIKSWYAPLSEVRAAIDKVTEGVDLTAKSLEGIGKDKQRQIWNLGASFQVLGGNLSEVSEDMAAFWSMLDENKGTLGINIKMDNMKEAFGLLKEIEEKAGSLEGLGQVKNLGKNVSDITSKIKVKIDIGEAVSFEGTEKLAEKLTKEVEKASDELDKAIVTAMRKTSDRKVLDFTKSKYGFYEYIDESDNKKKRKSIDFESMSELPNEKTINGYFKMLKSSVDKYGLNMKFEFFTDADEVSKDIISVTEYLNALNESIRNYNELNEGPGSKKLKEFSVRDLITTEDKSATNKDGVINPDMRDKEVRELKKYINEMTTSLSQTKRKIQDMKFDEALNLFVGRETKGKSGEIAEQAKADAETYFEELRKAFQEKDISKLMESFQLKDASGKKNKNVKILEDITGKSLKDQESIDKVIRRVNPTEFDRIADTKALRQRLIRNYDIKGTPPEIKELIDSLIEDIDGTVKSYIEASQKLQSKAEELGYIYQEFKGKKNKKNNNSEEQSADNEDDESYNFSWKKVKKSRDKGEETFADISVEKIEKPVEKAKEAEKTIENIVSEIAKTEIKIPEIDTSSISIAKDELVALLADYKKLKDEGNTVELEKQGEKIKEFVEEEKENISYFLDINKGEKVFDFDLFKEMDNIFGGDVEKALNDLDDVSLQNINEQLEIYYNRCKGVIATNDKLEETLQAFSNTKMNSDDVEKYWREITGLLKGVQNIDINSMERVYVLLSNIRGFFQEGPDLFRNINDIGKIAETLVNVGLSDVKSVFGSHKVSGSVQSSLKGVLGITSGSEEEKAFQGIISSINSKEITHLMEALQKISVLYAQIQSKAKETKDDVENLQNVNTDTASKEKSNIDQMENVSENLGKSAEELKETAEQVNEAAEKLEEAKNGKENTSSKPEKEKSKETVDQKQTIRQNSVTGNVTVTSSTTSRSESKIDNPNPQPVVSQPQPTAQPTSNTVAALKASKAAVEEGMKEINKEIEKGADEIEEKKNRINEILAEIGKQNEKFAEQYLKFNLDGMDDSEIDKLYNVLEILKDFSEAKRNVLISNYSDKNAFTYDAVKNALSFNKEGRNEDVAIMEKALSERLGVASEYTELFHEVFSQALDSGSSHNGVQVITQFLESISVTAEQATESLGKLANAEQEVTSNVQPTTTEAQPTAETNIDENLEETAEKVETAKDKIVQLLKQYKQETDDSNLRNIADKIIDAFSFEGLDDKGILRLENIINNLRNLPVDEVYDILSKYQNMDEFIPAIAKSMHSQTNEDNYRDTVFAMMEGVGAGTSTDIKIRKKFNEINGMEFGNISNLFANMEDLQSMSLDKVIDQIQKLYEKLKDAAEQAYKTKTEVEEVNQSGEQSSDTLGKTATQQNNPNYASRENMKAFIRGYSQVDLNNPTATTEQFEKIVSGTGGKDTLTDEQYTRLSYVLQHISELNFDEVVNLVMTLRDGEKYIDQFAEDYKMLSTSPFEANVKEAEKLKNVFFGMMKEVGGTEDISLINKILEGSQSLDEVKQKLRELYKEAIEASHAAVEAKNLELEEAGQKQEQRQTKQGTKKGRSKKAEPKQEPEQKAEDTAEQTQEQEKQANAVQTTEEKFKKLNDAVEKCRDLMKQAQENGKEFFSLYQEKGRYFEELLKAVQELDNAELQKFSGRSGNLEKNIEGQIDRINTVLSDDYDKDDYEVQTESAFTTILELLGKTIQKEEEQEQQSNETTEAQVSNNKKVKMSLDDLLDTYNKLIEAYKQTQDFDALVKGLNAIPNDNLRTIASTQLGLSNPRKNYNSKAGLVAASADVIRERYGIATTATTAPEPEPEKPISNVDTNAVNTKYGALNTTIKEINTGLEELSTRLKNLEQELQGKGVDTSFLRKLVDMLDQTIPNAINVKNKRFEGELGVVKEVVEKELAELKKLVDYISQDIPNAIGVKNEAFRGEESEVDRIVDAEISKFGELTGVTELDFTDAFNSLNEFLQNVANALQANTVDEFVKQLDKLVFSLEKFDKIKIVNSGFFTAIDAMLGKKDELQNLAQILAESEKKIEEAAEKVTGKSKKAPTMIGKEMQIFDYDSAEWDSFLKTAEKAEIKLENIAAVYRQLRKDEKTGNIYESFRVVDDKGNSSTIGADTTGVLARKDVSYNITTLSKEYDKLIKKMSTAKDMEGLNKIKLQISEIDKAMEEMTKKAGLGQDTLQKLRDDYKKVNADSTLKIRTNESKDRILETATANLGKLKQARTEYNNELAAAIASGKSEEQINASVASSLQEVEKAERKVADSMTKVNELYKNGAIEKKQYDDINKTYNSDDVTKGTGDSLKNVADAKKEQQKQYEDLYNTQRKTFEQFQKEQQKYDDEIWNEELVQRKKQAYEEINEVLRQYEDIQNRVLQGEQIAGYEQQLEGLKNKIYEMLQAVENSSNYDGNLERDITKQLVDSETSFGKAIDKDRVNRQTEAYKKLTQAVKDYITVSKKIARAGDKYKPSDVQKLLDAANVIQNMRPVDGEDIFDLSLDQEAMKGYDTLTEDLNKINEELNQKGQRELENRWKAAQNAANAYYNAAKRVKELQDAIDLGEKKGGQTQLDSARRRLERTRIKAKDAYQNAGQSFGTGELADIGQKDFDNANAIYDTYNGNFDANANSYKNAEGWYNRLINSAQKYYSILYKQDANKSVTYNELQYLKELEPLYERFYREREEFDKAENIDPAKRADLSDKLDKATTDARKYMPEMELANINSALDKMGESGGNNLLRDRIQDLRNEYERLGDEINDTSIDWSAQDKKTKDRIRTIISEVASLAKETEEASKNPLLADVDPKAVAQLQRQMAEWKANNSAAKEAGDAIDDYIKSLDKIQTKGELDGVKVQFERIKQEAYEAGKAGMSFGDKLKGSMGNLTRYLMSFASFYNVVGALRQGVQIVKELDTEMTNLKKVVDDTDKSFSDFQMKAFDVAAQLGTTARSVIEASTQFGRLGYNLEDSLELGKAAAIYSNVAELDIETSAKDLVATLKAFQKDTSEAQAVVDTLNIIGG